MPETIKILGKSDTRMNERERIGREKRKRAPRNSSRKKSEVARRPALMNKPARKRNHTGWGFRNSNLKITTVRLLYPIQIGDETV